MEERDIEIKRLKSENSGLRARLEVYEDGKPSPLAISLFVHDLENKAGTPAFRDLWSVHRKDGTEETIFGCIKWLRRISSANEVPNAKP